MHRDRSVSYTHLDVYKRQKEGLIEALHELQHLSDTLAEDAQHSIHAYMARRRVEVAHMMAHAADVYKRQI